MPLDSTTMTPSLAEALRDAKEHIAFSRAGMKRRMKDLGLSKEPRPVNALARLMALVDAVEAATRPVLPSPAQDYLTACPEGYDTVVGWLSVNRPDVIVTLGDAPACTQRDGFWLMHRCRERGIPEVWVRAPKVLADQGIDKVRAYPADLLAERLGE